MIKVQENFVRGPGSEFQQLSAEGFRQPFEETVSQLRGKKGLIVPAGGQAPGINLVLKNLVANAAQADFYGLNRGFAGASDPIQNTTRLIPGDRIDLAQHHNSINGSYTPISPKSDGTTLLLDMGRGSNGAGQEGAGDNQALAGFIQGYNLDFLVTIGGNGTLAATQKIENLLRGQGSQAQVLHMPKTVDGDLYGETFGLASAAAYTIQQIKRLTSEHNSNGVNPVINVFEIMGRGSGKIALRVADTCRQVDLILIPELPITAQFVETQVQRALKHNKGMNIVIAEGVNNIRDIRSPNQTERMIGPLAKHLNSRFGMQSPSRAKINSTEWTYDPRAVGGLIGEDESIINGMSDTALRALSSGLPGVSVVGTNRLLDLNQERPTGTQFSIADTTFQTLIRHGYSTPEINRSFRSDYEVI